MAVGVLLSVAGEAAAKEYAWADRTHDCTVNAIVLTIICSLMTLKLQFPGFKFVQENAPLVWHHATGHELNL